MGEIRYRRDPAVTAEEVAGNRFLRGFVLPGGVARDLPPALARGIEIGQGEERRAHERVARPKGSSAPGVRRTVEPEGF